jgi:hypothetical protein
MGDTLPKLNSYAKTKQGVIIIMIATVILLTSIVITITTLSYFYED